MINALTVDVEDYFHVQAFAGVVMRSQWNGYQQRVQSNTERILELFERFRVKATFFILGWVAERNPSLVKRIHGAGHEIACHGYAHQMIGTLNALEFRNDVKRARCVIEDIIGRPVFGYRAPSYSVTEKTMWALDILAEECFEFDSSIFPVHHDNYGIPNAPRFPFVHRVPCGRTLMEFPATTLRRCGMNLPVAGGGYLRLYPYKITAGAIKSINADEHQPAMIYAHPWEFDPDQPRIRASWLSSFRHYNNLKSTGPKFERLLRDFRWAPMGEVLASYRKSLDLD